VSLSSSAWELSSMEKSGARFDTAREDTPYSLAMERPRRISRISRRALLKGGAALLGTGAFLEWQSLRGKFDHRSSPIPAPSGSERYRASIGALERALTGISSNAIVHVGHSTHLLCVDGLRLLTDPWFYDPAFGALAHEHPPAVVPQDIGRLDAILVTHDHADHADQRAMDQMDKRAAVIVSTNELASRIRRLGYRQVTVLAPWEEQKLGTVSITAVPALHDIYEIGFVVRGAHTTMYFAGDTRLHPDLPAIAERFAPDVAILPVDGTRLIGGALHVMTPDDAVTAARTLKSRLVVPSHAEAIFSDPLVSNVLASTVDRARFVFGETMGRALPGVRCVVPGAGELVTIAEGA
jgi:L-ascorbate metabolism protein UlaG (beta-lactamase superfamily)